ncbi:MAG: heavy-metal-associated domain-containing protein [Burkholderiaceae bacterium]
MIEYVLDDMTCGHCEKAVRAAIAKVDPQAPVSVDLGAHRVRIDSSQPAEPFARALDEAGYPPAA